MLDLHMLIERSFGPVRLLAFFHLAHIVSGNLVGRPSDSFPSLGVACIVVQVLTKALFCFAWEFLGYAFELLDLAYGFLDLHHMVDYLGLHLDGFNVQFAIL